MITEDWVAMTAAAERFGVPVRRLMAATDARRLHWKPAGGTQRPYYGAEVRMVNTVEVQKWLAGEITAGFEDETEDVAKLPH